MRPQTLQRLLAPDLRVPEHVADRERHSALGRLGPGLEPVDALSQILGGRASEDRVARPYGPQEVRVGAPKGGEPLSAC